MAVSGQPLMPPVGRNQLPPTDSPSTRTGDIGPTGSPSHALPSMTAHHGDEAPKRLPGLGVGGLASQGLWTLCGSLALTPRQTTTAWSRCDVKSLSVSMEFARNAASSPLIRSHRPGSEADLTEGAEYGSRADPKPLTDGGKREPLLVELTGLTDVGVSEEPVPTRDVVAIEDLRHRLACDVERLGEGVDGLARLVPLCKFCLLCCSESPLALPRLAFRVVSPLLRGEGQKVNQPITNVCLVLITSQKLHKESPAQRPRT